MNQAGKGENAGEITSSKERFAAWDILPALFGLGAESTSVRQQNMSM